MSKSGWLLWGLVLLQGLTATHTAAQKTAPEEKPMKVSIVLSTKPGCEPNCQSFISAQGKITAGQTLRQFKAVLKQLKGRKVPVFIHSGGGEVREAMAIGNLIRAKGLDTAVIRVETAPSQAGVCASACVFILAGGTRRFACPWARIGVHQPQSLMTQVRRVYRITREPGGRTTRTVISETRLGTTRANASESVFREMQQYFMSIGVGPDIMPLMRSAPFTSMHWMTATEQAATKLITSQTTGLELVPDVVPPAAAVPAPPAFVPRTPSSVEFLFRPIPGLRTAPAAAPVPVPPALKFLPRARRRQRPQKSNSAAASRRLQEWRACLRGCPGEELLRAGLRPGFQGLPRTAPRWWLCRQEASSWARQKVSRNALEVRGRNMR